MTEALKHAIARYAELHANSDGVAVTPIPGLSVKCSRAPVGPVSWICKPQVCLVLQGSKQMTIGAETHTFSAGHAFIVGVDVPVASSSVQGTRKQPYIGIAIELDMAALRDLTTQLGQTHTEHASPSALFVVDTDAAALDCGLRLMRLIERPEAATILRPGIMKELHYWLLSGRHGASLRKLALPGGQAQRIASAIRILRNEYRRPIRVGRLAAAAGMSLTTFHRHFKAITSMTPVQFQKQLRLIEARRLMLAEGSAVSRAAFDVGYESVSQFTREYGRMFGASPRRDIRPKLSSPRSCNKSVTQPA